MKLYSYLALGDSYTIGEQVQLTESFPYQTVELIRRFYTTPSAVANPDGGCIKMDILLKEATPTTAAGAESRRQGLQITAPEIVASTGFTTDELNAAIDKATLLPQYDFVSLLIGVNNQYRGKPVGDFIKGFENLLQRAIYFAAGNNQHVFILSIPDWGVTSFAADRDTKKIAVEINAYNKVCELMATKYNTHFINITTSQRLDGNDNEFLAADKLHPSGKEYAKWAALLSKKIISCII